MSGVLVQKLGRIQSTEATSSSQYSRSSCAVVRQVKYVYDWVKPIFPRPCIIAGFVNASARKSTSGSTFFTFQISHSQKLTGLVCGLSTRKILTPWATQCSTTRRTSSRIPFGSLSKFNG
jgi:hypothetical protein